MNEERELRMHFEEQLRQSEERNRVLEERVMVVEEKSRSSEDRIGEYARQVNILTDYISLKESTYSEKIKKLEEELRNKN